MISEDLVVDPSGYAANISIASLFVYTFPSAGAGRVDKAVGSTLRS